MIPLARYVLFALLVHGSAAGQTELAGSDALATRLIQASEAERAALLTRPDMASTAVARALLARGDKAKQEGELRSASLAFDLAASIAERVGADPERGLALNGSADTLGRMNEFDRAITVARRSIEFHDHLGDANGMAEAWNTIGNVHFYRGEYQQSIDAGLKVKALWTSAGNRRGVGRALNNIGNVHKARGQLDEAAAHYEEALAIFEALGDRRSSAVVSTNVGLVHFSRGDYPQALAFANRSLAIMEELSDRGGVGKALDTQGNIYRMQGAYSRALGAFQRSLVLRKATGDQYTVAESENNIGLVHFSQGNYELAIAAYKRGLRVATQAGSAKGLAPETLTNIGAAAWRLGQKTRARANFEASLALAEREQFKTTSAANLDALGRVALDAGRTGESRRFFDRALRLREEIKDQAGIAETLNGLASLSLATRRFDDALEFARRSSDIAQRFEQRELLWEAHTLTGVAHRRLKQIDAARAAFSDAVRVVERLRLEVVPAATGGERFFESKLSPYHELIDLAIADGSTARALELAERAKSRVLVEMLRRSHVDVTGAQTEDERREEQRLRASLRSLNGRALAERTSASPDGQRLNAIEAERQKVRTEYEAFQIAVYAAHPELRVQRGEAAPFAVAEAARFLTSATTAILEFVVLDEVSHVFVLTREGETSRLDSYKLNIGREALAVRVRRLRDRLASRDLLFDQDARELYDLLLAPVRSLTGKTHLIVIPDGPLWEMPFQALRDVNGRYLVQSAAVSYAPSLAVLRESVRARPRPDGPPTLFAMGKADFGNLTPLPEAEEQVRRIQGLYGPSRSTVHLGRDASEGRFKAEAPRHRILHLASHGLFDESSPFYSSVVLSPGPAGSPEDGLLEAWEMLELKLQADLVILSACETGRGRIASGEGIVGTMWALFVAGSRATVVSQWKVEASSTTELMTAFHRRLVAGDGRAAEHLRAATLDVLENPRYAHPFYWAPFMLVGNPN